MQVDELFAEGIEAAIILRDRATGKPWKLEVSHLASFSELRIPIVHSLLIYSRLATVTSRNSVLDKSWAIKLGLLRFLHETDRTALTLTQIDRAVMQAFIGWLNRSDGGKAMIAQKTRKGYYYAAVATLGLLRNDVRWRDQVLPPTDIPKNPWPQRERSIASFQSELSEGELRAIFVAAAKAVREMSAVIGADLDLLGNAQPDDVMTERKNVLVRLRQHVRDGDGAYKLLWLKDRNLAKMLDRLGLDGLMRSARPEINDLVPFMVIFTIAFRLNSTVLLSAKRNDFEVRPWIGGKRVFARPYKRRAKGRQNASVAVTDEAINPERMLAFLDRWLEPLRHLTGGDALFQFWHPTFSKALDVDTVASPFLEKLINRGLKTLALGAGVDPTKASLIKLRKGVLDLVHVLSKGDLLKVKSAAGHASAQTTSDYYVTAAGMAREDEALARAMSGHATMLATGGKFDPRRENDQATEACTPGWTCERGARPALGALRTDGHCTSYGRCPVCRFGRTDFSSPRACAQNHLLVDAIERAIDQMPPQTWLARLSPIHMHLLEEILPRFPDEVHRRACLLDLPDLPRPE